MNLAKIASRFIVLALFLSTVSAQELISIESYASTIYQKDCQCQPASYFFYTNNTGDKAENYWLNIEGRMAKYAKATVPSPFILKPGQEIYFNLVIHAPCKLLGTKKFNFIIKSRQGLEAFYPLTYDIIRCQPDEIESVMADRDVKKGIPAKIIVEGGMIDARNIVEWLTVLLVLGAITLALFYAVISYRRQNGGKEGKENEKPTATEPYY